jgi:hypothetical protein
MSVIGGEPELGGGPGVMPLITHGGRQPAALFDYLVGAP